MSEPRKTILFVDDEANILAGLVHDVGKLLLAASLPEEYADVLRLAREQPLPCW